MINFLGIGSAFNPNLNNTSAYYKNNNKLLLLDCGSNIFQKLVNMNIFQDVEEINVFLTHTHSDHVGSLFDLISYAYYVLKQKVNILFPDRERILKIGEYMGVESHLYDVSDVAKNKINFSEKEEMEIQFIPTKHTNTMNAYGILLGFKLEKIYFGGDSAELPKRVLEDFLEGKIDKLFLDTANNKGNEKEHLLLNKLTEIIPMAYRKKVYCVHLDPYICFDEIKEKGFSIPKIV